METFSTISTEPIPVATRREEGKLCLLPSFKGTTLTFVFQQETQTFDKTANRRIIARLFSEIVKLYTSQTFTYELLYVSVKNTALKKISTTHVQLL